MNLPTVSATRVQVATWSELTDREPAHALVADVDLVTIRHDDRVSVMYGRCHHRGLCWPTVASRVPT
jgi:nitrite reductase/ring-hydroxylating ferredoxin subunit